MLRETMVCIAQSDELEGSRVVPIISYYLSVCLSSSVDPSEVSTRTMYYVLAFTSRTFFRDILLQQ